MSAFLAPIHTLVFNKILLTEELEKSLNIAYIDKYGDIVKDVVQKSLDYGEPIDTEKKLEDIIDKANIHGWLQDKIIKVETRTAYIITEMIKRYGKEAEDIAMVCFAEQGKVISKDLSKKEKYEKPEQLFNNLNNYLLEGMPCDRVTRLIKLENNILEWETVSCIHKKYWEIVNGDVTIFYNLRHIWIKSFVENANDGFSYNFIEGLADNDALGINQIITK